MRTYANRRHFEDCAILVHCQLTVETVEGPFDFTCSLLIVAVVMELEELVATTLLYEVYSKN
jgi:hypothetical protein